MKLHQRHKGAFSTHFLLELQQPLPFLLGQGRTSPLALTTPELSPSLFLLIRPNRRSETKPPFPFVSPLKENPSKVFLFSQQSQPSLLPLFLPIFRQPVFLFAWPFYSQVKRPQSWNRLHDEGPTKIDWCGRCSARATCYSGLGFSWSKGRVGYWAWFLG